MTPDDILARLRVQDSAGFREDMNAVRVRYDELLWRTAFELAADALLSLNDPDDDP